MFRPITRVVFILSLVSLFADVASEMLYPVMPLYLKEINFSVLLIGILEGVAEGTAGLSRGYFGKLSDLTGKRLPFVRWGYFLSALSKPMMVIFIYPLWIFFARTLDRFGKGLRTGARDALLSAETTPEHKGKVFGFHRGMDTFGAVLGPVMALIYLHFFPADYTTLFLIAFAPGIISVLLTFLLKTHPRPLLRRSPLRDSSESRGPKGGELKRESPSLWEGFRMGFYWKESPFQYRKLVIGLLLFALFNSSDMFLLLKVKESCADDSTVIRTYIFYNLIYAVFSFPLGILADRLGLKTIFLFGLILFASVYFGFAIISSSGTEWFYILFFVYGLYAASTEGISKAWISNVVPQKEVATAIGVYSGFQTLCAMAASTITGLLWYTINAETAFAVSAAVTAGVAVYIWIFVPRTSRQ